jgi:membrane protein
MLERLTERARQFYIRLNQRTNGWLAALVRAFSRFSQNRATETAAGISFYAIFSFFPLLVFLVMATSSLLAQPAIQEILRNFLATAFPISLEPLLDEVNAMLQTNDSLNLIALIGFMWAASSVFNAFMVGVNRAWGRSDMRSMIKSRLVALALVTSFAIVLVVFMIAVALFRLVAGLLLPFWQQILVILIPAVVQILILYLLYRWGPVTRSPTHKKAALLGAIITGLALEITNAIYTWYLQSGWSSYDVIYGSLGAIIGLLFWVYVSSLILLFGAYLAEAIDFRLKHDSHLELPEIFPAKVE